MLGAYLVTESTVRAISDKEKDIKYQEFNVNLAIGLVSLVVALSVAVGMYLYEERRRSDLLLSNSLQQQRQIKSPLADRPIFDNITLMAPDQEVLKYKMAHVTVGLMDEVELTRKSARLNMLVGVSTTATAVAILIFTLLTNPYLDMDAKLNSEIAFFVPRVSLSFLVEAFSFFFLKLYRRNLENVKYLTNELTNVKLKILALEVSHEKASSKCFDDILRELVKTERNFLLKKGESTVEIERLRIETDGDFKLVDKAADLVKKAITGKKEDDK
jgi:hypothetical protein